MELPKSTNTSALSGAGVMRLFNKVGETVNKIAYKMDETDTVSENFRNSFMKKKRKTKSNLHVSIKIGYDSFSVAYNIRKVRYVELETTIVYP